MGGSTTSAVGIAHIGAGAFGVKNLKRPSTVAPNQPYPHNGIYKAALGLCAAAILFALIVFASGGNKRVFSETIHRTKADASNPFEWNQPLKIAGGENIRIQCKSTPWCYVSGELYGTSTHKLHKFGVQDGKSVFMSAVPAGEYTLKMNPQWPTKQPENMSFKIAIHQGVPRMLHLMLLILGIAIIPLFVAFHHYKFAAGRWSDSDYSPYSSE